MHYFPLFPNFSFLFIAVWLCLNTFYGYGIWYMYIIGLPLINTIQKLDLCPASSTLMFLANLVVDK